MLLTGYFKNLTKINLHALSKFQCTKSLRAYGRTEQIRLLFKLQLMFLLKILPGFSGDNVGSGSQGGGRTGQQD